MDNFFTSYSILSILQSENFRATGVIRENRVYKAPLKSAKDFKTRGEYDHLCDGVVRLVRLSDSRVVTIATNFDSIEPLHPVTRYAKGGETKMGYPHVFYNYNRHMGGVDLCNRFVSEYKISIGGDKWYWKLFTNTIDMMRVAAWRLSVHLNHGQAKTDQLNFMRTLVKEMCTGFTFQTTRTGPIANVVLRPLSEVPHVQVRIYAYDILHIYKQT
jgi:hypothetical protein